MLDGRRIVLGVSGGIAAYKAIDVCRRLVDGGAHVVPVMTARRHPVRRRGHVLGAGVRAGPHVAVPRRRPDPAHPAGPGRRPVVVAPATARVIGSYAAGISSDLLTATLLAVRAGRRWWCAPAMHTEMWEHPAVQDNLATLAPPGRRTSSRPEEGRLAGGDIGKGRLAAPETIVEAVEAALGAGRDLSGLHVLVTAGGTREPIDPVRFVGNRSSGKQGHALAAEAADRGAKVTLVTTVDLPAPPHADVIRVETAAEMEEAVHAAAASADVVVMAAAVADFRPARAADRKLKKQAGVPEIDLEPTPDILAGLGERKRPGQTIVGFAAETDEVRQNAAAKLAAKGIDLIVANDVAALGAGFEHDTNQVVIMDADGTERDVPLADKRAIARAVFDAVTQRRTKS